MQWLGQQPQIYYQLLQTSGPQLQTSGQLFDLWNTSYVQFGFWTIETTCEWSAIESFGWLRAKSLCKTGCGCGRLILLLEPPDPPTETLVLSILHPNVHKSCWIASWLTVRRPIELAIKVPNYVNTSRPTQLFCPRSIRLILADNWKGHHWRAPADHQSRKIPI